MSLRCRLIARAPVQQRLTALVRPLAIALALLSAATVGAPPVHAAEPPLRLTIAFTGDVSGYLEPCG